MRTLKDHEDNFFENYKMSKRWEKAGVLCNKCGTELERDTEMRLLSNPPQIPVRCPKCEYRGSMH